MIRDAKLFLLTHLFVLYIVLDLQYGYLFVNVSHLAYNILPPVFYCYFLYMWITTSHLKLSKQEKSNIKTFIWFASVLNVYSCLCILVGNKTSAGREWLMNHNGYLIIFFIFIVINILNNLRRATI
jgi:hypothetical protein